MHLDAFGGNMLMVGNEVTAVLDIGETSIGGDRRLDPVSAAVYLSSPEISGDVTERDLDVVKSWLRAAELADLFVPVRRWLAGYWSFAADDLPLAQWCRSVLLERPARG